MDKGVYKMAGELQDEITAVKTLLKLCSESDTVRFCKGGTWRAVRGPLHLPLLHKALTDLLESLEHDYEKL